MSTISLFATLVGLSTWNL